MKTRKHNQWILIISGILLLNGCCRGLIDYSEAYTQLECEDLRSDNVEYEVILKYKKDSDDSIKNIIHDRIRKKGGIIYECMCGEDLELIRYTEDPDLGQDDRLASAESDTKLNGQNYAEVFHNTQIQLELSPYEVKFSNANVQQEIEYLNEDVTVAIIDGGIDYTDPYVTNNLWVNNDEFTGLNNENCLEGDIHGYDFTKRLDLEESEINFHGTAVSQVLLESLPNNINVYLMDLRIFDRNGKTTMFDALCAISYAIKMGADIMNMSWGYYAKEPNSLMKQYLEIAYDEDIIVVASAGNDGQDTDDCNYFPSSFSSDEFGLSNVISTAALNICESDLANYSNYGDKTVSIAAKGTHKINFRGEERIVQGTSYSAPIISCAVTRLKVRNPSGSSEILRNCLFNKVDILGFSVTSKGKLRMTNPSCD